MLKTCPDNMETMLISGNTHPGRRRKENQDACIFRTLWGTDKALLAVVDGVGGYAGGEKAAAIARDCIDQYMQVPRGDTLAMLREAVVFANNRIVEERNKDERLHEMCCVLTAVVADTSAGYVYYVHVGDTRLYRYRDATLQKLTKDHSFVGIREDAGELSEWEAMHHPHRNQILREVGSAPHRLDDEDFMDYGREDFLPGDLLLLCSDGLTDMLTQQQMIGILSNEETLDNKVNYLVALANKMGGHDNITVVLLQHKGVPLPVKNTPVLTELVETVPLQTGTLPIETPQHPKSKKSKRLWVLMCVILIAVAGWYFVPVKKPGDLLTGKVFNNDSQENNNDSNSTIPFFRSTQRAVPVPGEVRNTDTLYLAATKNLEDLQRYIDSTGRLLVLMPANHMHTQFAAIAITERSAKPGDTLLLKNLRLKDFETGINVHIPVILNTQNLEFENIRYPFSYPFTPATGTTPVLLTKTIKQ